MCCPRLFAWRFSLYLYYCRVHLDYNICSKLKALSAFGNSKKYNLKKEEKQQIIISICYFSLMDNIFSPCEININKHVILMKYDGTSEGLVNTEIMQTMLVLVNNVNYMFYKYCYNYYENDIKHHIVFTTSACNGSCGSS